MGKGNEITIIEHITFDNVRLKICPPQNVRETNLIADTSSQNFCAPCFINSFYGRIIQFTNEDTCGIA